MLEEVLLFVAVFLGVLAILSFGYLCWRCARDPVGS